MAVSFTPSRLVEAQPPAELGHRRSPRHPVVRFPAVRGLECGLLDQACCLVRSDALYALFRLCWIARRYPFDPVDVRHEGRTIRPGTLASCPSTGSTGSRPGASRSAPSPWMRT